MQERVIEMTSTLLREQINWETIPSEGKDSLISKYPSYYAPAVSVTGMQRLIFLSGRTGLRIDSQGNVLNKGDVVDQTETVMTRLKLLLENQGASLDNIVQVNVFLRDIRDREKHAQVRSKYFGKQLPASTLIGGVDLAREEMLVEINAIAAL